MSKQIEINELAPTILSITPLGLCYFEGFVRGKIANAGIETFGYYDEFTSDRGVHRYISDFSDKRITALITLRNRSRKALFETYKKERIAIATSRFRLKQQKRESDAAMESPIHKIRVERRQKQLESQIVTMIANYFKPTDDKVMNRLRNLEMRFENQLSCFWRGYRCAAKSELSQGLFPEVNNRISFLMTQAQKEEYSQPITPDFELDEYHIDE